MSRCARNKSPNAAMSARPGGGVPPNGHPQYRQQIDEPNDDKNVAKGGEFSHVLPRQRRRCSTVGELELMRPSRANGRQALRRTMWTKSSNVWRRVERVSIVTSGPADQPMVWWMLGIYRLLTLEWGCRWLELAESYTSMQATAAIF